MSNVSVCMYVDLGVDFKSRLESLGSGRFHLGSESNFSGVVCLFFKSIFLTLGYFLQLCVHVRKMKVCFVSA